jgi:conjugal transfer/entry exclusion protein
MQIAQAPTPTVIVPGNNAGNAAAVDGTALGLNGEKAATSTPVTPTPTSAAPLKRGLGNWDAPLQGDISGAQQALDFLEQSAAQLRGLKSDLSNKLAARQLRDGTIEARVRQFSSTWRNRQQASGGTLDPRLGFSRKNSSQRFSVRGMSLANLRAGGREVLAISLGGQNLRSVSLEPGLSDDEIAQRFDDALAPAGVRVEVGDDGNLSFSTPETAFAGVRDSFAVQGSGARFPAGQLNRIKVEPEAPAINPDSWQTGDAEGLRATLSQVMQALAQVEQAIAQVQAALSQASSRVQDASGADAAGPINMDQVAQNFLNTTDQPGYQSLLSITSALAGISRERVISLLGLR